MKTKGEIADETSGPGLNGWRSEERLQELYVENGLTVAEIADRVPHSESTVRREMSKHGIERRPDAATASRDNAGSYARMYLMNNGYECWMATLEGQGQEALGVHRLLAVAEYGFDEVAGNEVHHKNGVPWDNRPENLEVMSASDHGRLHSQRTLSDAELLSRLRDLAEDLGRVPRSSDVDDYLAVARSTYFRRFGGLRAAREAAGIESENGSFRESDEA